MSWPQMKFLQSFLDKPLVVNQLEMSLTKLDWLQRWQRLWVSAGKRLFSAGWQDIRPIFRP
ncbi:hypothetical protein [Parendozoicomonas callyspongiae]|uniref:hypothetical protein n=1 Tax=Parendozoicomonas callyspongiae TaxID=2942213 RepID=UPI0038CD849E